MIQHHPHRAFPHLGRVLVRRLAHSRSTFSGVAASGKPGAVHTGRWLFAGWCELRNDFRAFRIDRILQTEVTEDRFVGAPGENLQTYLATRFLAPRTCSWI
ncbi:WYL domain-containing protein [Polymorphobacter multimanifer]|uniref:WYL domain-containing protein n=1 Tax=Polymorphobacter multimanifer TaxID=1070431 RepID=UPI001615E14B